MRVSPELIESAARRARRSQVPALAEEHGSPEPRSASPTQRQERYATILAQTGDAGQADRLLERIIAGNDLVDVNYLELGMLCGRSVCRVHLRDGSGSTTGYGTGFLVAPGVLMTNHHVIGAAEDARYSWAEFDYERDARGEDRPVAVFTLDVGTPPLAVQSLDFALVGVSARASDGRGLEEFGHLPLNPAPGKAILGEYLTIIQHPGGERKQVCVRDNKMLRYDKDAPTLWYATDTTAGSSGSPVFNGVWQVVALHHSGVPKRDAAGHPLTVDGQIYDPSSMDESRAAWEANEGIRVSAICEYLRTRAADHPLARRVLEALGSQVTSLSRVEARSGTGTGNGREIRIVLQLPSGEVPVVVPATPAQAPAPSGRNLIRADAPSPFVDRPTDEPRPPRITYSGEIEKVNVDQSNYGERPGYDSDFLGHGLKVPLPTVSDQKLKKDVLQLKGRKGAELKYWNYSVIMNGARQLAIVSAVNVDPTMRSSNEVRDGDRWYADPRIDASKQIGAEFYSKQTTFEDRENNPFDKGHLTRRLDAQWGAGGNAKRNGDDSFHWTNCSPQHWKFNQGTKRWLGLEDYVIRTFAGGNARACVLNGCVFDAPRSTGENGRRVPDMDPAHRVADPTFGKVSIPRSFYKVVACVKDGKLAVAAFLMSQEDLLEQTGRVRGLEELTEEDARLYQVRLGDLARLTGLSFGPLEAADTSPEEELVAGPRPIHRFEDIRRPASNGAERFIVPAIGGRRTPRRHVLKS